MAQVTYQSVAPSQAPYFPITPVAGVTDFMQMLPQIMNLIIIVMMMVMMMRVMGRLGGAVESV